MNETTGPRQDSLLLISRDLGRMQSDSKVADEGAVRIENRLRE